MLCTNIQNSGYPLFIFSFGPETIFTAPVEYNPSIFETFGPNPNIQFISDWLTKAVISRISAKLPSSDDFCQKEKRGKLVGGVLYW